MMTTTSAVALMSAARVGMPNVAAQPGRQRRGERRVADDAVQHADRGDAHLHRRQELASGCSCRSIAACGAALAGLDHHLQPRLAAGRERHLRHGEQRRSAGSGKREGQRPCDAARCVMRARAESRDRGRRASVAESDDGLPDRRPAGLLRRTGPPARRDRLLAVARPPARARRPRQPRPASLAVLRAPARAWRRGDLPARQPRPAPAGRGRTACSRPASGDTLDAVLDAPDARRAARLAAPRHAGRPRRTAGCWCTPACVPQWDADADAGAGAPKSRRCCAATRLAEFLHAMYGNEPARWDDALRGADRWRFDRQRADAPALLHAPTARSSSRPRTAPTRRRRATLPWFEHRAAAHAPATPIAFGHWSTLGLIDRADLLALDTGCVWGGASPPCASTAAGENSSRCVAAGREIGQQDGKGRAIRRMSGARGARCSQLSASLPDMRLPAFVSTLKFRIVAIVAATGMLSAWGTVNLLLNVTQSELTRVLLANDREDRERTAGLLAGKIQTLKLALVEVARHSRPDDWRDRRTMEDYLTSQAALNTLFETVYAARPDGTMIARTEYGRAQPELTHVGDREYFQRALHTRLPALSDPVRGKIKKFPLVILAIPLFAADDAPRGVIAGVVALTATSLFAGVADKHNSDGAVDLVIDRKGIILSHPQARAGARQRGRRARPARADRLLAAGGQPDPERGLDAVVAGLSGVDGRHPRYRVAAPARDAPGDRAAAAGRGATSRVCRRGGCRPAGGVAVGCAGLGDGAADFAAARACRTDVRDRDARPRAVALRCRRGRRDGTCLQATDRTAPAAPDPHERSAAAPRGGARQRRGRHRVHARRPLRHGEPSPVEMFRCQREQMVGHSTRIIYASDRAFDELSARAGRSSSRTACSRASSSWCAATARCSGPACAVAPWCRATARTARSGSSTTSRRRASSANSSPGRPRTTR